MIGQTDPEGERNSAPEPDAMVLMGGRPVLLTPYSFKPGEVGAADRGKPGTPAREAARGRRRRDASFLEAAEKVDP